MITAEAAKQLGTGYRSLGDMRVSVLQANITDPPAGSATLSVKIQATFVYQVTPVEKQRIRKLIAGKPPEQARALLLHMPGIVGAVITSTGSAGTLPQDPKRITIIVVYRD
jgi:hypothetical protein